VHCVASTTSLTRSSPQALPLALALAPTASISAHNTAAPAGAPQPTASTSSEQQQRAAAAAEMERPHETDEDLGIIPGEDAFSAAADRVAVAVVAGGAAKPPEADLLRLYGLYKQATAGDCDTPAPRFWQLGRRQQWWVCGLGWRELRGGGEFGAVAGAAR